MSLIACPECGKQVSAAAQACPGCGFPIAAQSPSTAPSEAPVAAPAPDLNRPLAVIHPSWWRYFWHLVFCWLLVPLLIAWYRRASLVLRIYPGRIILERGIFTKCLREFMAQDIRSIDIDQGFVARLVGIGDLTLSTAATVDASERIEGIPHPAEVRDLILAQRRGS